MRLDIAEDPGFTNQSNSWIVVMGAAIAGSSTTSNRIEIIMNGIVLDAYVITVLTAVGSQLVTLTRRMLLPPGGRIRSQQTGGINASAIACDTLRDALLIR